MVQSQEISKTDTKGTINWEVGTSAKVLECIHQEDVNITIYERDISSLKGEIDHLLKRQIAFRSSGEISEIMAELSKALDPGKCGLIIQDIQELLQHFGKVVNGTTFRLLLATINTNMCRRFHTDINNVRMLCTYSGPGTLWLTDDNINQEALNSSGGNDAIVLEESKVQQAQTGAAVLLKGALYPQEETKAIVHRSPTIEESGERRLLLRVDTNETMNLWS